MTEPLTNIDAHSKNSNDKLSNLYEKIKKVIEIKNLYFLTVILTFLLAPL